MLLNIYSKNKLENKGFTLVETLVGVAVFLIIAIATYQAYISLFSLINLNQYKIVALNLANEQFEIIRNLSYSDVGIPGGIPDGKIPRIQNLIRSGISFMVTTTIRNIDLPFDGTIASGTDPSPADNKVVEIKVECETCKNFTPVSITTNIAPKNLETASTNGAILIKVFDSNGIPVPNASVHIVNTNIIPNIIIDDVTDSNGFLQIVDAPPGTNAYQITVTKTDYSIDRTYTPSISNPNPVKPDITVIIQQLTQISFSIDRLSSMHFSSVNLLCTPVSGINFNLIGSKNIGLNLPKYSSNLITNASGEYLSSNMEWDNYTVTGIDTSYDIIGINPLNQISLIANSVQNVSLIVAPKNPNSLLITVKDGVTRLPLTNAIVNLIYGSSYDVSKTTGRGFINQTDWSTGDYTSDDGNIDSSSAGELKLRKIFDQYNPSGWLESSTIDTGSASNFYNLIWLPVDQPVTSGPDSAKFQFATNATTTATTTWTYLGPDGTASTYYTNSNSLISEVHNGDRYARYKVYLSSISTTTTPSISDISFTVTSSCTPPGQVVFTSLSSGTYDIRVSKEGYTQYEGQIQIDSHWKEQEIILSP